MSNQHYMIAREETGPWKVWPYRANGFVKLPPGQRPFPTRESAEKMAQMMNETRDMLRAIRTMREAKAC